MGTDWEDVVLAAAAVSCGWRMCCLVLLENVLSRVAGECAVVCLLSIRAPKVVLINVFD